MAEDLKDNEELEPKPEDVPEGGSRDQIELDLSTTSTETIEVFVEEASDPDIFQEILQKNRNRYEVLKILLDNPNTPDDIRQEVASVMSLPVPSVKSIAEDRKRMAEQKARDIQKVRISRKIQNMTISEKVKLGMKGSGEARGILMKDSNKLVVLAVLDNPRLTDTEVEAMARSRSIIEDALRRIAKNKDWMKNYSTMYAIVTNPKTPPAIAMRFIPTIKKKDLGLLEKNKNVSEAVRTMAKKLVKAKAH